MAKIKANKAVVIDSIILHVEKGKGFSEVLALIGRKWSISGTTFKRYWKIANEQHSERQQAIKEAKSLVDIEAAINTRKGQVADVLERKEILTQIMRGDIPLTKPMIVNGAVEMIPVIPDWTDRRNAISELNKMDGSYAPAKVANTDVEGKDIDLTKLPVNFR